MANIADTITSAKPVTYKALARIADDAILPAIKQLQERCKALEVEAAELRAKNKELEARPPALSYKGVWVEGSTYTRGECVTDHGAVWHCNLDTRSRPGTSHRDWTMCVARGKPGRNER